MTSPDTKPDPKEDTFRIVSYPHPALRHPAKTVTRVDSRLRQIVGDMFQLMYEAKGIGLAAPQVGLPLRLFILNLEARPNAGEELVFINPVITHGKGADTAEEGCLSLPGLYSDVTRPKQVRISAYNLSGEEFRADVTGLFARAVQHEFDHLNGVLFIDRISEEDRLRLYEDLKELTDAYHECRDAGEFPDDAAIAARLGEWEARYCG